MPHLSIQYSDGLEKLVNMKQFCHLMRDAIMRSELYPLTGTRIRTIKCDHFLVADNHPSNHFVDMIFRIGKGRSPQQKQQSGDDIMQAASFFFEAQIKSGYLTISLELQELTDDRWQINPIHERLS